MGSKVKTSSRCSKNLQCPSLFLIYWEKTFQFWWYSHHCSVYANLFSCSLACVSLLFLSHMQLCGVQGHLTALASCLCHAHADVKWSEVAVNENFHRCSDQILLESDIIAMPKLRQTPVFPSSHHGSSLTAHHVTISYHLHPLPFYSRFMMCTSAVLYCDKLFLFILKIIWLMCLTSNHIGSFFCLNCLNFSIWRHKCPVYFDLILVHWVKPQSRDVLCTFAIRPHTERLGRQNIFSEIQSCCLPFSESCSESLLSSDSFRLI